MVKMTRKNGRILFFGLIFWKNGYIFFWNNNKDNFYRRFRATIFCLIQINKYDRNLSIAFWWTHNNSISICFYGLAKKLNSISFFFSFPNWRYLRSMPQKSPNLGFWGPKKGPNYEFLGTRISKFGHDFTLAPSPFSLPFKLWARSFCT